MRTFLSEVLRYIMAHMTLKDFRKLLRQTTREWLNEKAPRLGAALAFYSMLSLGPLILIVLAIAGVIFGPEAAAGKIVAEIQGMVGKEGARAIQDIIADSAQKEEAGLIAVLIGITTFFVGASGVFGQLQDAMNAIWRVEALPHHGIRNFLRHRFLSFTMVLGTGFLLLVSLVISAVLAAMGDLMASYASPLVVVMEGINFLVSFSIVGILFALIFKYVPDAQISWRDVRIGAIMTAFLFTLGKTAIGLYLGQSSFSSSYGAAGSLVVLLVWVYYSSQILFFGAKFTQVYANRYGKKILPSKNARYVGVCL
jgi:membrane protein